MGQRLGQTNMVNKDKKLKLDLGAGHSRLEGFKRVDLDKDCNPDYLLPCDNLKTINKNSVDEIYSAHLLEHFEPDETFKVLREWWRVLKPRGVMRIKVPDVGWAARAYVIGTISFNELQKVVFGSDPLANEFMRHKNLFCAKKLERFLFITGFVGIENLTKEGSGELHYVAYKPEV